MPTYTTTYSLGKPVVGADEDAWGDTLNASLDSIDDILDGTTPVTGIDINSGTLDGVTIGGTTAGAGTFTTLTASTSITGTLATAAQPNITSVGTLTGLTVSASASLAGASTSADITFGDNDKAIFGAGSDLQIYHDGSNSYINDVGAGDLILQAGNDLILRATNGTSEYLRANEGLGVQIYYNGDQKFLTTSTGIDVTGTVTADGLDLGATTDAATVSTTASDYQLQLGAAQSATGDIGRNISFDVGGTTTAAINTIDGGTGNTNALAFFTSVTGNLQKRLLLEDNGDISFYEDTGTTAKFFWDASAESLGIGTSSPSEELHVKAPAATIRIEDNVGSWDLETDTNGSGIISINDASKVLRVFTGGSESMRIDSSGNLLVGTTDSTPYNNTSGSGFAVSPTGYLSVTREGTVAYFNRNTSDGDIVHFRKDGTTVGSIGVDGNRLYINGDNGSSGGGLKFTATDARPVDRLGSDWDDAFDLGDSSARFDDIYATNGTIQTSDANEKQDIAELSDAEQRVAVAAKGLLRKFRWRDAVEEKGDEARTHFGIIAQDLQAAFAAEGLDAGDYAMFIHSTWTDEETGEEKSRMGVRYSELLAFIIAAI